MPIKIQVLAPGGVMMELMCETNHEVFEQLAFWSKLPQICPIDDMPTRLDYRIVDKNEFYSVVSTGPIPWAAKVGQMQDGNNTLFYRGDGVWSYWDYDQQRTIEKKVDTKVDNRGVGVAQEPPPKPASVAESATEQDIIGQDGEVLMSGADIEAAGRRELEGQFPPDPDFMGEDDAFVKGLISVAAEKGYTRATLEAIAKRDYGDPNLRNLGAKQLVQLSRKMKNAKAKSA